MLTPGKTLHQHSKPQQADDFDIEAARIRKREELERSPVVYDAKELLISNGQPKPRDEWQVIGMLQQLKMQQREQKEREDERRKKLL